MPVGPCGPHPFVETRSSQPHAEGLAPSPAPFPPPLRAVPWVWVAHRVVHMMLNKPNMTALYFAKAVESFERSKAQFVASAPPRLLPEPSGPPPERLIKRGRVCMGPAVQKYSVRNNSLPKWGQMYPPRTMICKIVKKMRTR